MGVYFNPGNLSFREITEEEYIDKTGLISQINRRINTSSRLICISRARRFGKSYAAKMLCAYYDCSCDSAALFDGLEIANTADYLRHMNQYHVIRLDITSFISVARREGRPLAQVPNDIVEALSKEAARLYPEQSKDGSVSGHLPDPKKISLPEKLLHIVAGTGRKFIFVIDEWDALIREAKHEPKTQEIFLDLLREWFKNISFTADAVAAAVMTGILPVKKDGSQSAISDFEEFTMIKPRAFGEYVGFTEQEVCSLCEAHNVSFAAMKKWYDGYRFKGVGSVYNPNSVMKAIRYNDFDSYWSETSAAEGLMQYISQDYNGLTKTIAELIGGIDVSVNTAGFANDLTTFKGRDDVLTLLIHLGYLAYDSENETARIPNEEIRLEFSRAVREVKHALTLARIRESEQLFLDTIQGNEEAVAAQIEKIHMEETSPLHYNREESLRSVIKLAYYTYKDHYLQWEELPAGVGYADVVYLPKHGDQYPALVIELKWNDTAQGAIDQILNRQYPQALKDYGGELLLVGITYDKDMPAGKRKHHCRIKKWLYRLERMTE